MTNMTEITADVAEELAPLFLELGKALYGCQAFEGTLVLLLSLISNEEADAEDGAFTSAVDLYSQKTLGQLLKRLADKVDLPTDLQTHLTLGWERRNAIVHRFVHEHIASLLDQKGRIEVEKMLVKYKQEVKFADIIANRLLDLYLKKYGLTVNDLKRNADRLWVYLNPAAEKTSAKH
jgi:signal transduction histidine kinase